MQPRLRLQFKIHEVTSFNQLQQLAIQAEEVYLSAQSFRPPPLPERSFNADLAYHPPKTSHSRPHASAAAAFEFHEDDELRTIELDEIVMSSIVNPPSQHKSTPSFDRVKNPIQLPKPRIESTPRVEPARAAISENDEGDERICWNCDQTGHNWKRCPGERKVFCFRCGEKEVTRPNCPHCSTNRLGNPTSGRR